MVFNTGESSEELKLQYNPEGSELRQAQLRMLDMLIYIKGICDTYNIQWILYWGNVLGAVRHRGFIPWDDDVDIALDRDNYKKLCKILKSEKHPQFVLQDHSTDKGHYCYYSVLRDRKSEYIQDSSQHLIKKYRGLQIDIFCLEEGAIQSIYTFMGRYSAFTLNYLSGKGNLNILAGILYFVGDNILIPSFRIISKLFGNKNKFDIGYGFHGDVKLKRIDRGVLFPPKQLLFEGILFPCPANSEVFCKLLYGDYMNLPPKENRLGHKAKYVLFD